MPSKILVKNFQKRTNLEILQKKIDFESFCFKSFPNLKDISEFNFKQCKNFQR